MFQFLKPNGETPGAGAPGAVDDVALKDSKLAYSVLQAIDGSSLSAIKSTIINAGYDKEKYKQLMIKLRDSHLIEKLSEGEWALSDGGHEVVVAIKGAARGQRISQAFYDVFAGKDINFEEFDFEDDGEDEEEQVEKELDEDDFETDNEDL